MLWAFERLGIAPDADERAIKRAYAQRVKTTRPDEDPEGFQHLREAYETALAMARSEAAHAAMAHTDAPAVPMQSAGWPCIRTLETVTQAPDGQAAELEAWPTSGAAPAPPPQTLRMTFSQDWGAPSSRTEPPQADVLAYTAQATATRQPMTVPGYVEELLIQADKTSPAAFPRWLEEYDALYDLARKSALTEPMLHELERRMLYGHGALGPRHLDALLRFFWLDQVSATRQRLEPLIDRLKREADSRETDWNRIMSERDGNPPTTRRNPPFWEGMSPRWVILFFILLVHMGRACTSTT